MSLYPEVRRGGNLPFGQSCNRWMCDPRYSTNVRTLYGILVSYADTHTRNTRRGRPYRPELARQLGCSLSTLDRTLFEGEVAGMWTIHERPSPDNPKLHDANVYELHDAPLMYAGHGEWVDPLPPGAIAADVAKARIEERRAAKRAAGHVRKGGVTKGVSTKKLHAQRDAEQEPGNSSGSGAEESQDSVGGSTGAATYSSTGAATVAAPVLPNVYSPVHSPSPEPKNPGGDGRRPSSGGGAREGGGGFAASSDAAAPNRGSRSGKDDKPGARMSREQAAAVARVEASWPEALVALLPKYRPAVLRDAILAALDGGRTAEQLAARVERRWWAHGYREALAEGGPGIGSPVGVAVGLVRPSTDCPDPMCEDGVTIDRDTACPACEQRRADRKADRRQGLVPGPREAGPAPVWWDCQGEDCDATGHGPRPEDGLCWKCHAEVEAGQIERATAGLRAAAEAEYAAQAERARVAAKWAQMLDDAYTEHTEREVARDAAVRARRTAEAEETRRLREQLAREYPELAAYAQQSQDRPATAPF